MFACWLTCGYFNVLSNYVNKKMNKKAIFLVILFPIEIRTLSSTISLKRAEFLVLTGIAALGIILLEIKQRWAETHPMGCR